MKHTLMILFLFIFYHSNAQLEGLSVNVTLRAGDWAFIAGSITPNDSTGFSTYRRIRDTIRLANPANYNTNVRINSLPAAAVFAIYRHIKEQSITLYEQIGTNINTQIKAIVSTPLQNAITSFDNQASEVYLFRRNLGKNIVMDN